MDIKSNKSYTCECCERLALGSDLTVTECGVVVCEECLEDYCYTVTSEAHGETWVYLK